MIHSNRPNRNHEKLSLFTSLKQTVECILSKRSANIWNVYGGFQSMLNCLDCILQHGYKPVSKKNQGGDFWPFVKNLEWLDLTKTSFSYHHHQVKNADHFLATNSTKFQAANSSGEKNGRKWLEHNLRELTLYRRLQTLLSNTQLVREYYQDWSFLLDSRFLKAFFTSIKALEANNPSILANLSPQMFGQQEFDDDEETTCRSAGEDRDDEVTTANPKFDLLDGCKSLENLSNGANTSHLLISSLDSLLDDQMKGEQARQTPLFDSSDDEEVMQISTWTKSYCPPIVGPPQSPTSDVTTHESLLPDDVITRESFLPDVVPSVEKSSTPTTTRSSIETAADAGVDDADAHFETSAFKLYSSPSLCGSVDTTVVDERKPMTSHDDDGGNIFPSAAVGFYDSNCAHRSTSNLVDFLRNQDLATCADIDKENAHFYFADIMITTLEQMKCNYTAQCRKIRQQQQQQEEHVAHHHEATTGEVTAMRSPPLTSAPPSFSLDEPTSSSAASSTATVSKFHFGKEEQQVHNNSERKLSHHRHTPSYTAELIAIGLLQSVSSQNTSSASAEQMKWLISEDDVPQKLLPIPNSVVVDCDMVSISSHWSSVGDRPESPPPPTIRIRGNHEWAPPRNQIIVKAPQKLGVKKSMEKQNNRCSGCGTLINKGAFKRLRYCEYLGKYFCTCCHENRTAIIPSHALQYFDFYKYKVSNFSFDHLERMYEEPLYNVADINAKLYKKNKSLAKIRKLREQLPALNLYIRSCRFIRESSTDQSCEEDSGLVSCSPAYLFDQLPPHFLTNEHDVFSIDDLVQCKNGELLLGLNLAHQIATEHLEKCQLCRMKGFICEFCNDGSDIIFSHQEKSATCGECRACYHIKCFQRQNCPKCERITKRKILLQNRSGATN